MTSASAVITTVRQVRTLIEEDDPPSDAALSKALDELAMAYHLCPPGNPADDDWRPERDDYPALYQALGTRFPGYGYYSAVLNPLAVPDKGAGLADAVDDLADIVFELREILWRYDQFGEDDALWHYRLNFQIHLGGHVRSLSGYLHARQFG